MGSLNFGCGIQQDSSIFHTESGNHLSATSSSGRGGRSSSVIVMASGPSPIVSAYGSLPVRTYEWRVVSVSVRDSNVGRSNLVGSHSEGVNVALFHSFAARHTKTLGVHLFRCHIANDALSAGCCAMLRDDGIRDNSRDLEVSNARCALCGDQNVPLDAETVI